MVPKMNGTRCLLKTPYDLSRSFVEHQDLDEFREETLKVHNELRDIHNAEPLVLNKDLNRKASKIADIAASENRFHDLEAGENVFMACTTYNRAITGDEVTNAWYDEVCHPKFDISKPDSKQARSFTQVVWKDSKEMGLGRAVIKKDHTLCTYVVALYKPPGNIMDKFEENVLPGKFNGGEYCQKMKDAVDNLEEENETSKREKLKKGKNLLRARYKHNKKNSRKSKKSQIPINLNKQTKKSELQKRTLYYKIPVRFITSPQSGSTLLVPRKSRAMIVTGLRRSPATSSLVSSPEFQYPVLSASKYLGMVHPSSSEDPYDFTDSYGGTNNADVQANYIKNELEKSARETEKAFKAYKNFATKQEEREEELLTGITRQVIDKQKMWNEALSIHNKLRAIHGAPPMKLNNEMCKNAEEWSKKISTTFTHAPSAERAGDGENLAYSCQSQLPESLVKDAIKNWYKEVCDNNYNFGTDGSQNSGHFTQIVWKESVELGIGVTIKTKGSMKCVYVVGRYRKAGNMGGEFTKNVLKGKFDRKTYCDNKNKLQEVVDAAANAGDVKKPPNEEETGAPGGQPPQSQTTDENKPEKSPEGAPAQAPNAGAQNLTPDNEAQKVFAVEALAVSNKFRAYHGSPNLVLDKILNKEALLEAQKLAETAKRSGVAGGLGENKLIGCNKEGKPVPAKDAVTEWYRQVCSYDFAKNTAQKGTEEFTQLVWKGTLKMGIAYITKKKPNGFFCTYVVAKYKPAGNIPGKNGENIKKGTFHPLMCFSLNTIASSTADNKDGNTPLETGETPKPSETGAENPPTAAPEAGSPTLNKEGKKPGEGPSAVGSNKKPKEGSSAGSNKKPEESPSAVGSNKESEKEETPAEFEMGALGAHNRLRELHGSPRLELNPGMCKEAEDYAKKLAAKGTANLTHASTDDGENLALKCGKMTAEEATLTWYKEVCSKYTFNSNGPENAGHFTQVVWKGSRQLGVGKAVGKVGNKQCTFIVARYRPAGNYLGRFKENVNKGAFDESKCNNIEQLTTAPVTKPENPGQNENEEPTPTQPSATNPSETLEKPTGIPPVTPVTPAKTTKPKLKQKPPTTPSVPTTPSTPNPNPTTPPKTAPPASSKPKPTTPPKTAPPKTKKPPVTPKTTPTPPVKTTGAKPTPISATEPTEAPVPTPPSPTTPRKTPEPKPELKPLQTLTEEDKAFAVKALEDHNTLRKIHGVPPLKLNNALVDKAKQRSKQMEKTGVVDQSKRSKIPGDTGENSLIHCALKKITITADQASLEWYSEICKSSDHNQFGPNMKYSGDIGHFTQMIWKSSTDFGMAKTNFKMGDNFCVIVVAIYSPRGNELGKFAENVLKGSFDKKKCNNLEGLLSENKPPGSAPTNVITTAAPPSGPPGAPSSVPTEAPSEAPASAGPPSAPTKPPSKTRAGAGPPGVPPVAPTKAPSKPPTSATPNAGPLGAASPSPGPPGSSENEELNPTPKVEEGGNATPTPQTETPPGGDETKPEETEKKPGETAKKPEQTEKKPGETEEKPGETEEKPGETEQKPGETEQKPGEAEKKPGEAEQKPGEEEQKPGEEEQKPGEMEQKPGGTEQKPAETEKKPGDTEEKPEETEQKPDETEQKLKEKKKQPEIAEWEKGGLEAHNTLREIHGEPKMTLNPDMCKEAAEYAKQIPVKGFKHSDSPDGENLAMACSSKDKEMSAKEATRNWYSEVCKPGYTFGATDGSSATGHFTQVVWKGSLELGLGRVKVKKGSMYCTYVVGRYRNAGNILGDYASNVPEGKFDITSTCDKLNEILKLEPADIVSTTNKKGIVPEEPLLVDEDGEGNNQEKLSSLPTRRLQ